MDQQVSLRFTVTKSSDVCSSDPTTTPQETFVVNSPNSAYAMIGSTAPGSGALSINGSTGILTLYSYEEFRRVLFRSNDNPPRDICRQLPKQCLCNDREHCTRERST